MANPLFQHRVKFFIFILKYIWPYIFDPILSWQKTFQNRYLPKLKDNQYLDFNLVCSELLIRNSWSPQWSKSKGNYFVINLNLQNNFLFCIKKLNYLLPIPNKGLRWIAGWLLRVAVFYIILLVNHYWHNLLFICITYTDFHPEVKLRNANNGFMRYIWAVFVQN